MGWFEPFTPEFNLREDTPMAKTDIPITRPARTSPDWGPATLSGGERRADGEHGGTIPPHWLAGHSDGPAAPTYSNVPAARELVVAKATYSGFVVHDFSCGFLTADSGRMIGVAVFAGTLQECLGYVEAAMTPRAGEQP